MEKIYLYNRDGATLWFERINNSDNEYILKVDDNHKFVLEYCRIIFDDVPDDALIYDFNWDGKKAICRAYDPSGGPYISLGEEIKGYKVMRIYRNYNSNINDTIFVLIKIK